jgi:hypothetical protein
MAEPITITITGVDGRQYKSVTRIFGTNFQLKTSDLPKGSYILSRYRATSDAFIDQTPFVKQ